MFRVLFIISIILAASAPSVAQVPAMRRMSFMRETFNPALSLSDRELWTVAGINSVQKRAGVDYELRQFMVGKTFFKDDFDNKERWSVGGILAEERSLDAGFQSVQGVLNCAVQLLGRDDEYKSLVVGVQGGAMQQNLRTTRIMNTDGFYPLREIDSSMFTFQKSRFYSNVVPIMNGGISFESRKSINIRQRGFNFQAGYAIINAMRTSLYFQIHEKRKLMVRHNMHFQINYTPCPTIMISPGIWSIYREKFTNQLGLDLNYLLPESTSSLKPDRIRVGLWCQSTNIRTYTLALQNRNGMIGCNYSRKNGQANAVELVARIAIIKLERVIICPHPPYRSE